MSKVGNTVSWVLGSVAALTTISLGYYWYSENEKKKEEEEEADEASFYPPEETIGSNLSQDEALRRANTIYTAMKGGGTDEDAIVLAQNSANASGLKLIYNKFGVRDGETLGQWYLGDLSGWWLTVVRAQWTNRGLTPPF